MATVSTLSTEEIGKAFGWKHRQQVYFTAQREKWRFINEGVYRRIGIQRSYYAEDVLFFARVTQRRLLIIAMGKKYKTTTPKALVRNNEFDISCPECGEFAVILPPAITFHEPLNYMRQIDEGRRPWACINGHAMDGKRIKLPPIIKFERLPWNLIEKK